MPKNAAEELGYPGWVVPFAALVIFVMGCVVLYAAVAFINLTIFFNEWSALDRAALVFMALLWGRYVVQSTSDLDDDEDQ